MTVDQRTLDQIALSWDEYRLACERLDREPNDVELGMIGALWSEHCGYKNSKPLLRLFPTEGPRVLTKAGEENAGVVDIGDGLCVAMKIESHNHPSAIEPYQGAATGVGGIVRDIFAMGARPIAILDSLRFGPLDDARNRYLFNGVVGGIGGYGNCLGVPTVGGEIAFEDSYSGNPLVNAMCVGVARIDRLAKARADGIGNLLMLVGADTGRDGIHGATFASVELDDSSEERRPAVQVGNPFMEKLLMEACLELTERHLDWITGLQDLGAAGLTSSAVECAAKAGTGIEIDVARVPRRERDMTPYDVMLSESQERMLAIVKREHEDDVRRLFERWELHCEVTGSVTDDGMVTVRDGPGIAARLPVRLLVEPPEYVRAGEKPRWLDDLQSYDLSALPDLARGASVGATFRSPADPPSSETSVPSDGRSNLELRTSNSLLLTLLSSPELSSKRCVYRQYDHQVLTNTVVGPGSDAAVMRIKGTNKAIALATDGDGRICYLDPFAGGAMAVAEAARNVVCAGATPVALTDCLNFGNPEKADVYYQLEQCIRGMIAACEKLDVPVISGNVSLYNETDSPSGTARAIFPTPVVGMLGLIDDVERVIPMSFQREGDAVYLLGGQNVGEAYQPRDDAAVGQAFQPGPSLHADPNDLAGSEYLKLVHGLIAGRPTIDLDAELHLEKLILEAAHHGAIRSAHDCSRGGLAVALAECCIGSDASLGLGASAVTLAGRLDATLFGEAPSRIIVSTDDPAALESLAAGHGVLCVRLGLVTGNRLLVGDAIDVSVEDLRQAWEAGLGNALRAPSLSS